MVIKSTVLCKQNALLEVLVLVPVGDDRALRTNFLLPFSAGEKMTCGIKQAMSNSDMKTGYVKR